MRRLGVLFALLALVAIAIPVTAQDLERHPHMLLQDPEIGFIDGVLHLIEVRKCVDLAGNETVPLHAHHERLHFGDSGVSLDFETLESRSGNAVIPAAPFPAPFDDPLPWGNCDEFATFLPLEIPQE